MQLLQTVAEVKARLRPIQAQGLRVALVPTMGALHDGHLSLVRIARSKAEVVCASIFVNPKQFGPSEDLARYPRDLDEDVRKLDCAGCDLVFAPSVEEMYPEGHDTKVQVARTSEGLCGAHRPGHFDGVATVVLELFAIARPDTAVFGEKDFQQLAVIRRMAADLRLDVEIVGAPLVREPDGLAMSSRNAYLSDEERARALSLSRALFAAKREYDEGARGASRILDAAQKVLDETGVSAEYLELRRFTDLVPLARADEPAAVLVAARIGKTRLIDNVILRRP